MAKTKTVYFCQNCGAQSSKWVGKCTSCGEWNTYVEEVIETKKKAKPEWDKEEQKSKRHARPMKVREITQKSEDRIVLDDKELNRALGGGIVNGSLVLLGGDPGIGKSTLMLQIALHFKHGKVLYVSGEESERQIKMRSERIGIENDDCFILCETQTNSIFHQIGELQPDLVIIDSIQTIHTAKIESSPGSISQIRECASEFLRFAKETSTPVVLIGHITKEGHIAGPKILEHMVDTVLQFEGDRNHVYRIVRAIKNRFGSTPELGIYEMAGDGLREVANPSKILLANRDENLSGIAVSATVEGMRPLLVETQALVSTAVYGTPQRSSTGFDTKRMNMLLAVLEKRCGFRLGAKDVFLNITGGIKVDDPAIDLGVICAILSSSEDISVPAGTCFAAEVGLSGEIRPVNRVEARISEAEKLGFEQIFISAYCKGVDPGKFSIQVKMVKRVEEVFSALFG
jgi:DNA repair protein RadA/Sms